MSNKLSKQMTKEENKTTTTNGMKMKKSSMNAIVDLFFAVGGSRGKDIIPQFTKALKEDQDLAVRVALYARDAREGMGERQLFRDMMQNLAQKDYKAAQKVLPLIPVLGRWDDVLALVGTPVEHEALSMYSKAIEAGDGLAAKWAPRLGSAKHHLAVKLRDHMFGVDPGNGKTNRTYRKTLSSLTKVVEQKMSSGQWEEIDFNTVPSVAAARYQRAFQNHQPSRYDEYKSLLEKGEGGAKINAGAVYPYDVIRSLQSGEERVAEQQWKALPDWIPEGRSFFPMIDVSGSMGVRVSGDVSAMDIAISLGLYCSQRSKGAFKNQFLTFSANPNIIDVGGLDLKSAVQKTRRAEWGMNTNIERAYEKILDLAVKSGAPQEDMPEMLLIFSDMQFDRCTSGKNSISKNISQKFKKAGYEIPKLVFWNLHDMGQSTPVKFTKEGVGLVSGFSPSLMKTVLQVDETKFDPLNIVKEAVMVDRYDWNV